MTVVALRPRLVSTTRRATDLVSYGQQGLAGPPGASGTALTPVHTAVSVTAARHTLNIVDANNVTLTLPAGADDGELIQFLVSQASTGFVLNGGAAKVDGQSGNVGFPDGPCSGTLVYLAGENNWFLFLINAGQNPA